MIAGAVIAYLIGSIPFALLVARVVGADLRRVGSGNLGATNVMRATGVKTGVLVAVLDVAKGAASVAIVQQMTDGAAAPAIAGFAAVVGHIYPVWLKFRGGKGVATACGVFSVLTPGAVVPALLVFGATVAFTKYVSAGSVLASLSLAPIAYLLGSPASAVAAAAAAAVLIVFRHRSNIWRLRAGTETRIGEGSGPGPKRAVSA
jgi:glycerol-3-phosphate acyltransferase PlsY